VPHPTKDRFSALNLRGSRPSSVNFTKTLRIDFAVTRKADDFALIVLLVHQNDTIPQFSRDGVAAMFYWYTGDQSGNDLEAVAARLFGADRLDFNDRHPDAAAKRFGIRHTLEDAATRSLVE
jgi:hypothetical protein